MIKLKYGNTNTFFIPGRNGGLLIDTDYAGTLNFFYKEIKKADIILSDIRYVLASHYHPDHMGLIGELMRQGVKLLLIDGQVDYVHFSDAIFKKDRLPYVPVNESAASVITCGKSRDFLYSMGIFGEIISTPSHSPDSITLLLDDGNSFAGDLEPEEYADAYGNNEKLKRDWDNILSFNPKTVFFSHRPEKII